MGKLLNHSVCFEIFRPCTIFMGYSTMRKRVLEIIEIGVENDTLSKIYDAGMMVIILISIFPLVFKTHAAWMDIVDGISVTIFIIDYLLRWITADLKYHSKIGFFRYPFGLMAIIDLLAILPSLSLLNNSLKLLKLFRLFRSIRVLRVFKIFRYSKSINMIINVFMAQKETLATIAGIAVGYVLISALVILNVEPETFDNYFEAVYWATISLTTVGYGDIYPITILGKIITMISSVLGIAIVALPAGVITAGIMEEINKNGME